MDHITASAHEVIHDALIPTQERIKQMLASLPVLRKEELDLEESCPICLVPFGVVFEEEELEQNEEGQTGGVTKLVECRHIFCRKDLTEWIRGQHGSCPTCRNTFLYIRSESDDESSDGGEYIPNPDEFEEEDEDPDASADEFQAEYMELDIDEIWQEENRFATQEELDAMWDDDGFRQQAEEEEAEEEELRAEFAMEEEDDDSFLACQEQAKEEEAEEEELRAEFAMEEEDDDSFLACQEQAKEEEAEEEELRAEFAIDEEDDDSFRACQEQAKEEEAEEEELRAEFAIEEEDDDDSFLACQEQAREEEAEEEELRAEFPMEEGDDDDSFLACQEQAREEEAEEEGLRAEFPMEEEDDEEEIDSFSYEADRASELGLTDGESDPSCSEGDASWGEFEEETRVDVALQREVSISVSVSGIEEAPGVGEFEEELDPKSLL